MLFPVWMRNGFRKGLTMSNILFFYLPLLQAMALQLFACASFVGPAHIHRRMFTPFTLYLFLLSCGVVGTVLMNDPEQAVFALYMRFICILSAFLFLGEFSLRVIRLALLKRLCIYAAFTILAFLILFLFEYKERGEIFALYLPGFPALIFSTMTFWKLGTRFPEQENAFRIASITNGGIGFAIVTEMLLVLRVLPVSDRLDTEFHLALTSFAFICTIIGSLAFLSLLKDIRFTLFRRSFPGAWVLIAAFVFFVCAAVVVPRFFALHAEKIAYQHVNYSVALLERDLEVSAGRLRQYVQQLSQNRTVIDALKKGGPNRSSLGEQNILERFATAHQRAIVYITSPKGICLDSSLKSSTRIRMVGQNISFTHHFQEAMEKGYVCTISVGSITGLPSIFVSRRIDGPDGSVLGVLTAREDFGFIFKKFADVYAALITPDNTIFMTNEKRLPSNLRRWRRGMRWWQQGSNVNLNGSYIDGIMYAERPCNFLTEPGWRVILGLPAGLPILSYIAGEILIFLLWLLPSAFFTLYVLHYRMRRELDLHLNWRKTIFNNNTSGIFVTDLQCNLMDANRTFSLLSGYTVEELRRMKLYELCSNSGSERDLLIEFAASGKRHYESFLFPISRKNGKQSVVCLAGNRFHNAHLNSYLPTDGLIWTVTDISRQAEEIASLHTELSQFRSLVESSVEQVAVLDPQGVILYSNDREIAFILQNSQAPLHLGELYDPLTTSLFLKMIQNVITSHRALTFQYMRKTPGAPGEQMVTLLYPIPREGEIRSIGVVTRKSDVPTEQV